MNGTASKDADPLFQGILEYYANLSGLEITSTQLVERDKFKADNGIICDDSLDSQILALQDQFVSEDSPAIRTTIILQVIALLNPGYS